MQLRVTTESDTYVYATSPLRIAGLDPEDFIVLLLPMAIGSTAELPPMASTAIGAFFLWLYKTLTANQPSGFLQVYISAHIGYLLETKLVKKNSLLRKLVLSGIKVVNKIWVSSGLLPTPSYCNLYER